MDRHRIVVVTPTYNERQNIVLLAEKIFALGIPELSVTIVDDNSPDGTGKLAEELSARYPLRVIHREKKLGLGRAYVEAFRNVLENEKPEIIIQMDADLSHDPKAIPLFLEAISDSDVALGSRYIPGGRIENWNTMRQWISKISNVYARIVLGLPYRDLTGGYKCFRKEVLEKINLDSLSSVGYNFQIETTYRAHKKGCRIREIPITFTERKSGASKFNIGIILESFIKGLLLRLHD